MILEWFIAFVMGLIDSVSDWLPEFVIPTGFEGALSAVLTLNAVVPAAETVAVIGAHLLLLALLFVYRVLKTAAAHIPFIGGTG